MVEIAISVAAKVAEYFVAPIVRPFRYIWNYKTNFQNLETAVGMLKGKQDAVQHLVDDARRNGEEIEQHVIDWLDTVQKKVDEVSPEIIQEKNEQANMKCFNGLCPNPKKLYQHSRNAVRKAKSIVELQQEGNLEQVSHRAIPKEIWIPSYKGYEAFESRKSTWEKIINALSNPDVNMLSIYGIGGIGKTTLARAVAEHAENNKLFDVVAFAEVSEVPDIRKIQGEIADMLGLTFHEESIPGRANKLHKCLKQDEQKKKILLVLDNIWATLELDKVGIPFGDDCKGCKVLLTARDLDALTSTGSQLNFSMDVLNDQETWNLFSTTAGDCIEQSDLQVLAKEVATACGGLPIAIVTIAKALRNKKEFEWRNALQELKKPCPRTLEGVAGPTYSCIEFSYNQLKDEELRSIFLLCSTMGSTNIDSIGDLVKYGMGLRIFKGIERIKEARDRIDTLFRILKDVSLLLDTPNTGCFSMHDVVRDVGRLIASRNQHVVKMMDDNVQRDWDDDDTLKTSTRISLHKISELPEELECQHLEFLYMQTYDGLAIPDNFFTKMSKLRVLHLVGFDLLSLPTSLCLLANLRTFCMDRCRVKDIALIGELKKLEILSLGCYFKRFPKEVSKFTGLRLLDLSACYRRTEIPPNIIASLTQLEALYLDSHDIQWKVQGGSNASLDELKCLPHLTDLKIRIPNTDLLSKGMFCINLEMYNINIGQRSQNYHFQENWPKTSRELELNLGDNCSCLEDVLHQTPSVKDVLSALDGGEGFTKLKQLWVHHSSCFSTVADCSESESYNPFPSLETLFLEELNNLEKIYNRQFGAEFLRQLRNIKVEKCDKLKNIFSFSTTRDLPLEEIEVHDCANITEIFAIGNEEDMIHLKELRSMTLEGLPKLTSFCSINNNGVILEDTPTATFNGKVGFPNLKTLKLSMINSEQIWHNQLLEIPSCFQSLKELYVEQCPKLKYLFSSPTVVFPGLEMIQISYMNDLEMIWQNQLAEDSFRSLKSVKVKVCNKLLTIFKFSMLERCARLESLSVQGCDSLEEIFDLQEVNLERWSHSTVSSQLRELDLQGLPKMRHIWNKDPQRKLSFQKLNKVKIENCRSLENIFPASIARNLSQLEQLHISGCGAMEKIFAEEEGADLEAVTRCDFPRLTSLELRGLSQLRYFYPGRHTAEWPALNKLSISDCDKIGLLASEENNEEGQLNIPAQQQPFFFVKKGCFLKLEQLQLTGDSLKLISQAQFSEHLIPKLKFLTVDCGESVFPPDILWRFPHLEKLQFNEGSYEEIFSLEEVEKHAERPAQIKSLELQGIEKMKCIWKQHSKLNLIIQKLEILHVRLCGLTDLLPPSAIFRNLKILHVWDCHKLTSILTSSTAESLVQLTEMKIERCDMLTEVVARDEGDVTKNKIIFHKLKILVLYSLSSLTNFCVENYTFEFPALEKLKVFDCTKMEIFCPGVLSTAKLNKVLNGPRPNAYWIWKGDLNTTIQVMYRRRNKKTNAKSSKEDGAGPSTQHQVLQNTECSEEDMIHLKELCSMTYEGLLRAINNNEVILEDTPTATFNGRNAKSSEEDGAGPSTQHQMLQNTEGSEEDGAGPSTKHPVLQNTKSYEEDGAGPSTQHLKFVNASHAGFSVPAAQTVFSSGQSGITSVTGSGTLTGTSQVPQNSSLNSFTSATSNMSGNSNHGISQPMGTMQGGVSMGQPIPGMSQGNHSGAQMVQSGISMNQNMMSGLGLSGVSSSGPGTMIPTPGMSQQAQSGMQQLGVNNNSAANMPLSQQTSSALQTSQSKYVKVWEGNLSGQRQGQPVFITKLEGYRSSSASETLAANWPTTMQIVRLISQDHMNNKQYVGKADFLVFRAMNQHGFLGQLQEKKLCAVIQLPSQTLLLSVSDKAYRLIGMLFPGDMVVFKPQMTNQQQQLQQQHQIQQQQQQHQQMQPQMQHQQLQQQQIPQLQQQQQQQMPQLQQQQIPQLQQQQQLSQLQQQQMPQMQQQQQLSQPQQMVGSGMGQGYVQGAGRTQLVSQSQVSSQGPSNMPGGGFMS